MHAVLRRLVVPTLAALLVACGPSVSLGPPGTPPPPAPPPVAVKPTVRPDATFLLPPAVAMQRGLMPLNPTGVAVWHRAHPEWDGRGVLLAILDSGVDPTIDGLKTTSTGRPKLVDARDFSGEGRIPLTRVTPQGDAVAVGGKTLRGFGRVLGLNSAGPWYGGTLRELALGDAPAADVNWNNSIEDTLAIVVTKATDGWVLFADLDGDGSLANERPIHDYAVARESFGWAAPGRVPTLGIAANFADLNGEPSLDLYFDTFGHGTHVAGIAAGHDLYGVAGFDGVAPGVELLGLKIANDAQGGVSTTGAMLAALDYAIKAAAQRHQPLVINMSFGVGNELEGAARIDQLIDSVLAAHPDVVFAVSAGNDGPGRSTIGFPGSASRVISVGATFPRAFLMRDPGVGADPIAYFSARGGELARPDIVAPGVAFSTVPNWDRGIEVEGGTSMASPQVAGLAALLVSALGQSGKGIDAARIRQALVTTAQPLDGLTIIDQGGGVPDVGRAWGWLSREFAWSAWGVTALRPDGSASGPAAFRGNGLAPGDTIQRFRLTPVNAAPPIAEYSLRSDAPWLGLKTRPGIPGPLREVTATYNAAMLRTPGTYVGTATLWGRDTLAGPLARLVNTIVVPYPAGTNVTVPPTPIDAGLERHWSFMAEADRPFRVEIGSATSRDIIRAYLHEPGGQPFRGGHELEGANGQTAAQFFVDARDVAPGIYEAVAVAPPIAAATAGVTLSYAPITMLADARQGAPVLVARNVSALPVEVIATARVRGAAREVLANGTGADTGRVAVPLPAWVRRVEIDLQMPGSDWPKFTDFGVTLEDATGHQITKAALNYPFGRLEADLPRQREAGNAVLKFYPGWATTAPDQRWTVTTRIRLYGDSTETAVLAPLGGPVQLAPGNGAAIQFAPVNSPFSLPEGYVPLLLFRAGTGTDRWTREAPLAPAPTPMMPAR